MSNDDHKKAPQSPEEMLAMIGKREDMVARDGDGETRGPETVAREEIAKGPPEIPIQKRPIGSLFEAKNLWQDRDATIPVEEHGDPIGRVDTGSLLASGYRTPEENEKAQSTADSAEDQDNNAGGYIELDIPIEPPTSPEPDADVMGYLHSRYGTEPEIRDLVELYDVRLSTVRLTFEPQNYDEWYYEINAAGSFACGFVDGELSDVCDHVDQIAREILQDDLTHF